MEFVQKGIAHESKNLFSLLHPNFALRPRSTFLPFFLLHDAHVEASNHVNTKTIFPSAARPNSVNICTLKAEIKFGCQTVSYI